MKAIHNYLEIDYAIDKLFSKSKDTIMKAIHNIPAIEAMSKYAVFKEQRYDNESNSQQRLKLTPQSQRCFQRAKIR